MSSDPEQIFTALPGFTSTNQLGKQYIRLLQLLINQIQVTENSKNAKELNPLLTEVAVAKIPTKNK